ncbi:hypothetical protein [Streptomyces sp. 2131.1]|uniref:MmyB family transcriptional regulator n=1 Tax=Streptomyces sp. 2131.1 TaxID=1855346 RepID=UPI00210D58D1|nr:hypothetical protein [Streptomyces sp. 2131.1]
MVGQLRVWAGVHPEDAQIASLIGELAMKSDGFRKLWASQDVANKTHGTMRLTHSLVGEPTLRYETLALQGDRDQYLKGMRVPAASAPRVAM